MEKIIWKFLEKGENDLYLARFDLHYDRFELYAIPECEWRPNKYFEMAADDGELSSSAVPTDMNVYVLRDHTQNHSAQWFVKFPYSNTFKQMYQNDVSHLGGDGDMFSLAERHELDTLNLHYDYYTANTVIIRGGRLCYCGTNITGTFSIGEKLGMTDGEIDEFLKAGGYDYEMLHPNTRLSRIAKDAKTGKLYIYSYDDIHGEEAMYVLDMRNDTCNKYEVDSCAAYTDGGTMIVEYHDEESAHKIKYDTRFNNPMKNVLDDEIALAEVSDAAAEEAIGTAMYRIAGIKIVK